MNLERGCIVRYIDVEPGKNNQAVKVAKYGVWDGEKVILNDKENTTVYKKDWLLAVLSKREIVDCIKMGFDEEISRIVSALLDEPYVFNEVFIDCIETQYAFECGVMLARTNPEINLEKEDLTSDFLTSLLEDILKESGSNLTIEDLI